MRKFGLVACVLVLLLTPSATPVLGAAPVRAGGPSAGFRTVTLVTGDRAGKGRTGMVFRRWVEGGDTYVLPADAASLVAAKRVDRRLFNVSKLVQFGYDDSKRKALPLIVSG